MFLLMNASSFARYSATSICWAVTPSGLYWAAIFPSVSPCFTS